MSFFKTVTKFGVLYKARKLLTQEIVATPERICSMELADGWLVGRSVGLLVCQFLLFNDAI